MSPIIRINNGSFRLSGGAFRVATPPILVPQPPGSPTHWYDFTDIAQLSTDDDGTIAVTADGDDCASCVNKGSDSSSRINSSGGTANPPRFSTNLINGYSGVTFDEANTEGIGLTAGVTFNAGTTTWIGLTIAQVVGDRAAATGVMVQIDNSDAYQCIQTTAVARQNAGVASSQQHLHGEVFPFDIAMWGEGAGASQTSSVNLTAGTDQKDKNSSEVNDGHYVIGCNLFMTGNFCDNLSILESLFWAGSVPTSAELETYVTDKYLLAWA